MNTKNKILLSLLLLFSVSCTAEDLGIVRKILTLMVHIPTDLPKKNDPLFINEYRPVGFDYYLTRTAYKRKAVYEMYDNNSNKIICSATYNNTNAAYDGPRVIFTRDTVYIDYRYISSTDINIEEKISESKMGIVNIPLSDEPGGDRFRYSWEYYGQRYADMTDFYSTLYHTAKGEGYVVVMSNTGGYYDFNAANVPSENKYTHPYHSLIY